MKKLVNKDINSVAVCVFILLILFYTDDAFKLIYTLSKSITLADMIQIIGSISTTAAAFFPGKPL